MRNKNTAWQERKVFLFKYHYSAAVQNGKIVFILLCLKINCQGWKQISFHPLTEERQYQSHSEIQEIQCHMLPGVWKSCHVLGFLGISTEFRLNGSNQHTAQPLREKENKVLDLWGSPFLDSRPSSMNSSEFSDTPFQKLNFVFFLL